MKNKGLTNKRVAKAVAEVKKLKTRKDGTFVVSSKSHVRFALERLTYIDEQVVRLSEIMKKKCLSEAEMIDELITESRAVKEAIDNYVVDGAHNYEDDSFKITRVQGHTRKWNPDKLKAIVGQATFKNLVEVKVVAEKVDEYVRKGKLSAKTIAPAFEETPNKAYSKWTKKSDNTSNGEAEADDLAAALG